MVYFKLIFVEGTKSIYRFIFLPVDVKVVTAPFVKKIVSSLFFLFFKMYIFNNFAGCSLDNSIKSNQNPL